MQSQTFEFPLEDGTVRRQGFRLKRLEILNWGTFHEKVAILKPDLGWTLLVGANGSGKSTAIDALRTLLVRPQSLKYNDASGDQRRKDRTKKSYVRGTYATKTDDDSGITLQQHLREAGQLSIVLGVFANEVDDRHVTLAQVFIDVGDEVKTTYAAARADMSIPGSFKNLGSSSELRGTLKERGFTHISDSYSAYAGYFKDQLSIPSDGALEIFNQAIGLKDVPDINLFIRQYMLTGSDVREFITNDIQPHFLELDSCFTIIKKSEKQLETLAPIVQAHKQMRTATEKKAELETLLQAIPCCQAFFRNELLKKQQAELEIHVAEFAQKQEKLLAAKRNYEQEHDAKLRDIAANQTNLSLQRIKMSIESARERKVQRRQAREKYGRAVAMLSNISLPDTEVQFAAIRLTLVDKTTDAEAQKRELEEEQVELRIEIRDIEEKHKHVAENLETVRRSGGLIPPEYMSHRKAICELTNIDPAELPFAGELMQVKSKYGNWTGAIERLLHSFGISLLAPERHYHLVSKYVDAHHLKLRFTFHRVPQQPPALRPDVFTDEAKVPARLEYRDDNPVGSWVKSEITRKFAHHCCADESQLENSNLGITINGLIRDGQTRHTKDDRRRVDDAGNYVLGWSTEAKIKALIAALDDYSEQKCASQKRLSLIDVRIADTKNSIKALGDLSRIADFDQINVAAIESELLRLKQAEEELLRSDNDLRILEKQVAELKVKIQNIQKEATEVGYALRTSQATLNDNVADQRQLSDNIAAQPEFCNEERRNKVLKELGGRPLTLDNIQEMETQITGRVNRQVNSQLAQINQAVQEMLPVMATFLQTFPEFSTDLKAQKDFAMDFVALQVRIEKEELPKYRVRFEEYLTETLTGNIGMLRQKIEVHAREIKDRLKMINAALAEIPFSEFTYVQIISQKTRHGEIKEFELELKDCTSYGLSPTQEDRMRIFQSIRKLLNHLNQDPKRAARVTDARHWSEFSVRELAKADDTQINTFSASTGKSGGQKAKLAFSILASAITAQYGIFEAETQADTFRLVVIDEAFARTDETNSQQALNLFKNLGLQLLIINPFDAKGRLVEDYVDSIHLVDITADNKSSIRRASREEYEKSREDIAYTDAHDTVASTAENG